MEYAENSESIFSIINHDAKHGLTTASLNWTSCQPEITYTIAINSTLSIELDKQVPVRPSAICWYKSSDKKVENDSRQALCALFGKELADGMLSAKQDSGMYSLRLALNKSQRLVIAQTQYDSPSTPPLIRKSCGFIMYSHARQLFLDEASSVS